MPSRFVSFGYKHGAPKVPDGALIVDVRDVPGIRNPWRLPGLQGRNGLDPDVQSYIASGPAFTLALDRIRDRVRTHDGPVYIGCHGGTHRSVYVVELLSAFFEVERSHLHVNRTPY